MENGKKDIGKLFFSLHDKKKKKKKKENVIRGRKKKSIKKKKAASGTYKRTNKNKYKINKQTNEQTKIFVSCEPTVVQNKKIIS